MWLPFCCVLYDLLLGKEPIVEGMAVLSTARFVKLVGTRTDMFNGRELVFR
jgi:hypothetical protein